MPTTRGSPVSARSTARAGRSAVTHKAHAVTPMTRQGRPGPPETRLADAPRLSEPKMQSPRCRLLPVWSVRGRAVQPDPANEPPTDDQESLIASGDQAPDL